MPMKAAWSQQSTARNSQGSKLCHELKNLIINKFTMNPCWSSKTPNGVSVDWCGFPIIFFVDSVRTPQTIPNWNFGWRNQSFGGSPQHWSHFPLKQLQSLHPHKGRTQKVCQHFFTHVLRNQPWYWGLVGWPWLPMESAKKTSSKKQHPNGSHTDPTPKFRHYQMLKFVIPHLCQTGEVAIEDGIVRCQKSPVPVVQVQLSSWTQWQKRPWPMEAVLKTGWCDPVKNGFINGEMFTMDYSMMPPFVVWVVEPSPITV